MKPKAAATTLFPEVPEDLGSLSLDELNALADEFQSVARRVVANDQELLADIDEDATMSLMEAGLADLERIRTAVDTYATEEQAYTERMGALAEGFGVEDAAEESDEPSGEASEDSDDASTEESDEPSGEASDATEGEAAEGAEEPAGEASEEAAPVRLRRPPAARAAHQPRVVEEGSDGPTPAKLRATGYTPVVAAPGAELSRDTLIRSLGEAQALINSGPSPAKGTRIKHPVASAQFTFPEERMLGKDANANWEKIQQFAGFQPNLTAITASGGFCAPYPPLYDLPIVASDERPLRAFFPGFGAPRGGIQYPTPLGLSDVIDGITIVTPAQDEAGGSDAVKVCVVIECDEFLVAEVDAIAACVEHGNLNARAWPERVANVAQLLSAAHAQAAEGKILASLTAGSTATTDPQKYGAYSSILQGVLKAAAAYRSRHRMSPDALLDVVFPNWLKDAIAADLAHNGFGRMDAAAARSAIEGHLSRAGVRVGWYIDQDGTTQQVYGAQEAGTLDDFLTAVKWYIFHPGAWSFLDMGRMDFGVTRDAELNSTNDFNVMWETFEGMAKTGVESVAVISQICPNGLTAGEVGATVTVEDYFDCVIAPS